MNGTKLCMSSSQQLLPIRATRHLMDISFGIGSRRRLSKSSDGRRRFKAEPPAFAPRAFWQNSHLHCRIQAVPTSGQGARACGHDRPKITGHVRRSTPSLPAPHAASATKLGTIGTALAHFTPSRPRSSPPCHSLSTSRATGEIALLQAVFTTPNP